MNEALLSNLIDKVEDLEKEIKDIREILKEHELDLRVWEEQIDQIINLIQ